MREENNKKEKKSCRIPETAYHNNIFKKLKLKLLFKKVQK